MPSKQDAKEKKLTAGKKTPKVVLWPEEYNISFKDRIDKRYARILLASLLLHFATVAFLHFNPPSEEADLEALQERFASIVPDSPLQQIEVSVAKFVQDVLPEDLPEPRDKNDDALAVQGMTDNPRKSNTPVAAKKTQETPSLARGAEPGAKGGGEQKSDEADDAGILGLLASSGGSESGSEVQDVLGKGLPKHDLSNIDVGGGGSGKGSGSGTADAGSGSGGKQGVKGGRATVGGGIDDIVSGLGKAESGGITVSRTGELEVEAGTSLLGGEGEEGTMISMSGRNIDEVAAIVQSHNAAIQYCYQRELKNTPTLKGKVVVRFSITPQGTVKNVKILASTLNSKEAEDCIVSRIRRWNDFGAVDPKLGDTTIRQVYTFGY